MRFTHEIPSEFENESRWFGFLTLKSLLCCLAAFSVGIVFAKITAPLFGSMVPGIIFSIILGISAYILTTARMPVEDYLKGGGLPLDTYLINRIYRKRFSCIYVLGYGNDEEV